LNERLAMEYDWNGPKAQKWVVVDAAGIDQLSTFNGCDMNGRSCQNLPYAQRDAVGQQRAS
jgi:hypothetical protein